MPDEPTTVEIPQRLNLADHYLSGRLAEGNGERIAVRLAEGDLTYSEVEAMAARFGRVLKGLGARPEERVMIALPDGPEWVGAFFGILKIGAVVVMVNPGLKPDALAALFDYVEPAWVIVDASVGETFTRARATSSYRPRFVAVGGPIEGAADYDDLAAGVEGELDAIVRHRDDAAIWLFSGGTTGRPKAVVQTHRSFANTTELYAKRALGYRPDDVTLSVPKLYFGYATGLEPASFPSRSAPRRCCSRSTPPRKCSSRRSPATARPS